MDDSLKEEVQTALLALMCTIRYTQSECHAGQGYSEWDAVIEDAVGKGAALLERLDPAGVAAAGGMGPYCSMMFKRRLAGIRVEIGSEFEDRNPIASPGNVGKA